ncbi:MAG: hypothetical protein CL581_19920 [Alteromonadaceae bacterium]|nr:hypothetical protein [Alteromonadaceae bacterium]MBH85112.1 hypothetical protein [Alteromonadaceae bacterium]
MSMTVIYILLGIGAIAALMLIQRRRTSAAMGALVQEGFIKDQCWDSNVSLVTEKGSGRFAVVWPGTFKLFHASQITGVTIDEQEMEANRHRYKVVVSIDDPECPSIGLTTNTRKDRAEQWAAGIDQWRRQYAESH